MHAMSRFELRTAPDSPPLFSGTARQCIAWLQGKGLHAGASVYYKGREIPSVWLIDLRQEHIWERRNGCRVRPEIRMASNP